jgi:predicted DNA-binding antitoxin AbrB/MazE fold protein
MPKIIEVIYENGVFKPLERVDIPEGSKLKIVVEDFSEIDRIHEDIKKITGEISKEKILEVLDEAWI